MTVKDPQGNQATDTVDIVVGGPNQTPQCSITAPDATTDSLTIAYGELALFRGTAFDPDVTPNQLTATWTSSIDGELNTTQPSADGDVVFGTEDLSGGLHTITLSVTDEVGGNCSTFILFTVSVPPQISIPAHQSMILTMRKPFIASTVFDQEDSVSKISLSGLPIKMIFHTQNADSSGNAVVNYSGLSADNHVITATVTDTDQLTATSVVTIQVTDCSATYWYLDADSDGFGAPGTQFAGCSPPAGYVEQAGDCNDNNASAWPGAPEYCDGIDNNCDNAIDEQSALDVTFWYADDDGWPVIPAHSQSAAIHQQPITSIHLVTATTMILQSILMQSKYAKT